MKQFNRSNAYTTLHRRCSSAPEVRLEARTQEEQSPLVQLNDYLLNRVRKQLDKLKESYRDLLKDNEQALALYNETRIENMQLRNKVAMLERALIGRTGAASNSSSHYSRMH
jgi:hypothetical protein